MAQAVVAAPVLLLSSTLDPLQPLVRAGGHQHLVREGLDATEVLRGAALVAGR